VSELSVVLVFVLSGTCVRSSIITGQLTSLLHSPLSTESVGTLN